MSDSPRNRLLPLLAVVAALVSACAPKFGYPYTRSHLNADRGEHPGRALAHYLSQPEADPQACALRPAQAHDFDRRAFEVVLSDARKRRIEPVTWGPCTSELLRTMKPGRAEQAMDVLVKEVGPLLQETDTHATRMFEQLAIVYTRRKVGLNATPSAVERLKASLVKALARTDLPAERRAQASSLLQTVDIEAGRIDGQPISARTIEVISDTRTLDRIQRRAPAHSHRELAKRQLVRLRVAASPFAQVRQNPEAVVSRLMRHGVNSLGRAAVPGTTATFSPELRGHAILVRQHVRQARSELLSRRVHDGKLSIVPTMDLRAHMALRVPGYEHPVRLCADPNELDPSPCVQAEHIALGNPVASVDALGTVHFREDLTVTTAVQLLRANSAFALDVSWSESPVASLRLPIHYERPEPLHFAGPTGMRGPDIVAEMYSVFGRVVVEVGETSSPGLRFVAILEQGDSAAYRVSTIGGQGARGAAGMPGSMGASGTAGMRASCPYGSGGRGSNGHAGGRGGNGRPGGPGGDGGDAHVTLWCDGASCKSMGALASMVFQSLAGPGGAGGAGGQGGQGGAGGAGGSGASCTVTERKSVYRDGKTVYENVSRTKYASAGSPGSRGPSGPSGSPGPRGPDGQPGSVRVSVRRWPNATASVLRSEQTERTAMATSVALGLKPVSLTTE